MPTPISVLIVGAGPCGLAAALELARLNVPVRILDKNPTASKESRAVAINPRTLDLLEPSGATERLLAAGVKIVGARLVVDGRVRAQFDATRIPHRFNFLLGLAQNETERILAECLFARGVAVERGVEVVDVVSGADNATARARTPDGDALFTADWIIGADGAHSTLRHRLGLEFPGAPYPYHWSLADVELSGDAPPDKAELRLEYRGPVLVRAPLGHGRHRLISNAPNVLLRVPESWKPGKVLWKSDFTVSHRMVRHRGRGRIRLVGDAAHVHSPAGGWGMNLGIEDAVTLARALTANGSLEDWERTQQRHAARTVRASDALQRLATSEGFLGRALFPTLVEWLARVRPIHDYLIGRMAGVR